MVTALTEPMYPPPPARLSEATAAGVTLIPPETPTIVQTLELLERRRVEIIIGCLRAGILPPLPRQPLSDCDPEGLLLRLGLHHELAPVLDWPVSKLKTAPAHLQN